MVESWNIETVSELNALGPILEHDAVVTDLQ